MRLPPGERAPVESDCISIEQVGERRYALTGSLLSGDESIAIIESDTFETFGLAEAAGAEWAERAGVTTLYVSTASQSEDEGVAE